MVTEKPEKIAFNLREREVRSLASVLCSLSQSRGVVALRESVLCFISFFNQLRQDSMCIFMLHAGSISRHESIKYTKYRVATPRYVSRQNVSNGIKDDSENLWHGE